MLGTAVIRDGAGSAAGAGRGRGNPTGRSLADAIVDATAGAGRKEWDRGYADIIYDWVRWYSTSVSFVGS